MAIDSSKLFILMVACLTVLVVMQQRQHLESAISDKLNLRQYLEDEIKTVKQAHAQEKETRERLEKELEEKNKPPPAKTEAALEPIDMEGLEMRFLKRKNTYLETCKEFMAAKPDGRWYKTSTVLSILGPQRKIDNDKWDYYMAYFDYDSKHDIVLCSPPKTGTTNWKKAMIALMHKDFYGKDNPLTIQKVDQEINWQTVFSLTSKALKEEKKGGKIYKAAHDIPHKMHKILNVRHPLRRLHSAWKDKFTKLNDFEHDFTTGQVFNYYDKSIKEWGNETAYPTPSHARVSFYAFANFVSRDIKSNAHWRPVWQVCWPCLLEYDFISRTETLGSDSRYMFDKMGISDIGYFPSAYESYNGTMDYVRRIYKDFPQDLLDRLYKYYFWDFKLFGYGRI